jgi:hypothetical protein
MAEIFDKTKFLEWAKSYTNYAVLTDQAKAAFEGWDIKDPQNSFAHLKQVNDFLESMILLVEKFSKDIAYLDNSQKLDVVVEAIDDMIKLPFYFEWADQIVIKYIISTIVTQYNKNYGHSWLESVVNKATK